MFWKTIRWGGTALVLVLLLVAAVTSGNSGEEDNAKAAVQPVKPPAANKNFNL